MQDRFKFRLWDKNNKVMHYNAEYISSGSSGNDWIIFKSDKQELEKDKVFNNPYFRQQFIIMQSTGLKDENGKLIYEGDIVKNFHVSSSVQGRIFIGYVTYDDTRCRFYIQEDKHCGYITFSDTDDIFEVIGNIYENPELLED